MSCSDKISLWNCVGIQGAMISLLIPRPIIISQVVVFSEHFEKEICKESIERALQNRSTFPPLIQTFPALKHDDFKIKSKPMDTCIYWYSSSNFTQVGTEGKILGSQKCTKLIPSSLQ